MNYIFLIFPKIFGLNFLLWFFKFMFQFYKKNFIKSKSAFCEILGSVFKNCSTVVMLLSRGLDMMQNLSQLWFRFGSLRRKIPEIHTENAVICQKWEGLFVDQKRLYLSAVKNRPAVFGCSPRILNLSSGSQVTIKKYSLLQTIFLMKFSGGHRKIPMKIWK